VEGSAIINFNWMMVTRFRAFFHLAEEQISARKKGTLKKKGANLRNAPCSIFYKLVPFLSINKIFTACTDGRLDVYKAKLPLK